MNYKQIYDNLMKRATDRQIDGYTEKHHIIPKCMNGSNAEENIAVLTAREHFIAHQLLIKIYPGHRSLAHAAYMMTRSNKFQTRNANRLYAWLREKASEYQKNRVFSDESKRRMSEGQKRYAKENQMICPKCGKSGSPSNMKRWHFDNCGKKMSQSQIDKMQAGERKPPNIVTCPKCGKSGGDNVMKRFHFDKCGTKQSLRTVKCPHCQKEGSASNMKRWHFDNCKHKGD